MRRTTCAMWRMAIRAPSISQLFVVMQQFCCELVCGRDSEGWVVGQRSGADVPELPPAVVNRGNDANNPAGEGIAQHDTKVIDRLLVTPPFDELYDA